MMGTQPLPLSIIADVVVVTSSPQVASPTFNTGLVIGPSSVIPSYGANSRTRKYLAATYSTSMISDGFTSSNAEYICAQIYFSQSPQPAAIYIGRQDLTAISAFVIDVAGNSWAVGDEFTVTQSGASNGVGRITAATSGVPSAISIYQQGTGYSAAVGLATAAVSPSTGTGLTVSITAIGESALQAAQACRANNSQWYPFMVTDAAPADHIAVAAWTQSQIGTVYFGNDHESNVLNGVAGNTFDVIYGASSSRTWMQYATTQSGALPNQIYFTAAIMGQAMASNTQLANSSFTEKFSGGVPLVGVYTEPLTTAQIGNIEGTIPGQGPNGNLFLNYANAFSILEQGTMMASNVFFDQILGLDVLASGIQYNILNLLTSLPKVPQTDAGQQLLIQAVENALNNALTVGFIAPGIWEGQTINVSSSSIVPGQSFPSGYAVVSPSYAVWGKANPGLVASRQAPPIYVAIIEAGAVHFVTIQVLVQI